MSFCCGAAMIGTVGTLQHLRTRLVHVPILYCPVCHRSEVHYRIQKEYQILAEYVAVDGRAEINFQDYLQANKMGELYENCINQPKDDPMDLVDRQIDMALDLLLVAKEFEDSEWEAQLKERLASLSAHRETLAERRISG